MKLLLEMDGDQILQKIPLKKPEYLLGRSKDSDIVFDKTKVSRLHAKIVSHENNHIIMDFGSTNYVFVNGLRIKRRKLKPGDIVQLSSEVTLVYMDDTDGESPQSYINTQQFVSREDLSHLHQALRRCLILSETSLVLEGILREALELVGAERGFISLLDDQGQMPAKRTAANYLEMSSMDSGAISGFSNELVKEALYKKNPLFMLCEENSAGGLSADLADIQQRAVMCAPLGQPDRSPLGVLYVDAKSSFTDFSYTDQYLFTVLAEQAAVAIDNALRWTDIEQALQQTNQLYKKLSDKYRTLKATVSQDNPQE